MVGGDEEEKQASWPGQSQKFNSQRQKSEVINLWENSRGKFKGKKPKFRFQGGKD